MPRTTNKGVRFTGEELGRVEKLRAQLPEYSSEADLLHHAALLGILVLATYATRPGQPSYAGYAPDDLAALLKPRLLPAIDFLLERDALPALFMAQRTGTSAGMATPVTAEAIGRATPIDKAVAADLEGFGTGFIDD